MTERAALTNCRPYREGRVRTRKESDYGTGTHVLKTTSGRTSRNTEGMRLSEGHSQSGDRIGNVSTQKESGRVMALTSWRPHREGQVRTRRKCDQERALHQLETASGGACQDTKRKQVSEGNSLSGNRIRRNKSGYGKEAGRGELAFWRPHQEG